MDDSNNWETRRQRLIKLLITHNDIIDLKGLMKEFEYPNKRFLIEDVISISKTLKNQGKNIVILPPSCLSCGFVFQHKGGSLKIPSKCPKCREQRIEWPSIKIE